MLFRMFLFWSVQLHDVLFPQWPPEDHEGKLYSSVGSMLGSVTFFILKVTVYWMHVLHLLYQLFLLCCLCAITSLHFSWVLTFLGGTRVCLEGLSSDTKSMVVFNFTFMCSSSLPQGGWPTCYPANGLCPRGEFEALCRASTVAGHCWELSCLLWSPKGAASRQAPLSRAGGNLSSPVQLTANCPTSSDVKECMWNGKWQCSI